MKYFITGITGQIGTVMAKTLLERGDSVIGMYRRTANSNFDRLEETGIIKNPALRLCSGDVTDFSSIDRIIKQYKPDRIINFAASSHVHESFKTPIANLNITGAGCVNMLESIRTNRNMGYNPKFVQISSSEMFGGNFTFRKSDKGFCNAEIEYENCNVDDKQGQHWLDTFPNDCYQNEDTPLSANSPYAAAKIYGHNMTELYKKAYDMYVNSIILFNTESEYRRINFVTRKITDYVARLFHFQNTWRDRVHLVAEYDYFADPDFITVVDPETGAARDRFPKLRLGNLESMRDWTYAEDSCNAILLSLNQEDPDTYVVCSGQTQSIQKLCELAFAEIGIQDIRNHIVIDPKFYRPVEVPFLRGDSSKIRSLGWEPTTDFESIVSIMLGKDIQRTQK